MYTHVWVVYYWCLLVLSVILQLYYDYQTLTGEGWWGRGGTMHLLRTVQSNSQMFNIILVVVTIINGMNDLMSPL